MILNEHLNVDGSPTRAVTLCAEYFRSNGAAIESEVGLTVRARGPFAIFSFDRRLYSRANSIGFNPLAFIDRINVNAEGTKTGVCLHIKLLTLRVYFFPLLCLFVAVPLYHAEAPIFAWVFLAGALSVYFAALLWMLRVGLKQELRVFLQKAV
jgi:hypothetical protein